MLYGIRTLKREDCALLHQRFASEGTIIPERKFLSYYSSQQKGECRVFLAEYNGEIVAYIVLLARSIIGTKRGNVLPQITDLNVLHEHRNHKLASQLIKNCETEAIKINDNISIAIPISQNFGNAQILFAKRGYIPDGSGLWLDDKPLEKQAKIDDSDKLKICMTKILKELHNQNFFNF